MNEPRQQYIPEVSAHFRGLRESKVPPEATHFRLFRDDVFVTPLMPIRHFSRYNTVMEQGESFIFYRELK